MSFWMQRPIKAIHEALRNNELKARDLLEEAISNHHKWDKDLNAYRTWDAEYARRQVDIADIAFQKNKDLGNFVSLDFVFLEHPANL